MFMEKNKKELTRLMAITLKAVIVKDNNEVLLLKRSTGEKFNKNKWDLPGGHLEKGETVKESLKREIKEETGLDVRIGSIVNIVEFSHNHQQFKNEKRGLRFIAYYQSGKVILDDNEHSDFKWLPIEEAINKLDDEDGFEKEKKETLLKAKKYLEMQTADERWKRAVADLDNYKKRVTKQNEEFRKYCAENLILELLPVIDNFEMAVSHIPEKDKKSDWTIGIMHIKNQLEGVLNNEGVEKIQVKPGDKIDENIHNVISGDSKKGQVKKTLKTGYKLGERVIRPASVIGE